MLEAVDGITVPDPLSAGELGVIARDLARRVGAESTLLAVRNDTSLDVEVLAAWGVVASRDQLPLSASDGFVGRVLSGAEAVLEPFDAEEDGSLGVAASGARLTHAAGGALGSPGGPVGALCAGFSSAPHDSALTLWMVDSCARLASLCLLDRGALDGLLAGTQRDALTGCLNYQAIRNEVIREIGRSERHRRSVSCCFIDLDHFKRVNGRYGHLHGNQVLANIARVLRAAVRDEDTLGRYGGDEFVLLLPDTDETAALELAERLRWTITATMINLPHDPIDASIGVAQWEPGSNAEDLLAAADQALLAAKALGGGTVVLASRPRLSPTTARSADQNRERHTTELPRVLFCGYCAERPTDEMDHRVCSKCGQGVVISASVEIAPSDNDAFLIINENLVVEALSKDAQSLLGVSESTAVDRDIDDFLTSADPYDQTGELFEAALARSVRGDTTVQEIAVQLRTTSGDTIPFSARIGRCGPPTATLIVLTDTT